jgi:hypothetical protein
MEKLRIQEFFSSADSREKLRRLLRQSGFVKTTDQDELPNSYEARGVFINLQKRVIDKNVPHRFVCVMELYSPLEKLEPDHPVFRLFGSLNQPVDYGDCALLGNPEYGIQEYAGIVIPYAHPAAEAEGSLCVEWLKGGWCRTVRDITGERVEVSHGLGTDKQAYDALLKYFGFPVLKFPNYEGLEFSSPSELEGLVRSGAYAKVKG